MRYGRIYEGVVVSVTEPSRGRTIEQHVGEDQAVYYTPIPDHVDVGFQQQMDDTWLPPAKEVTKPN